MKEVFAAALQDHRRAVIVGERTSGRGSFQNVGRLNDHELVLTTAILLRPSGRKLDRMKIPGHRDQEWASRRTRASAST
jgi:carboxyl-terminal processing protease